MRSWARPLGAGGRPGGEAREAQSALLVALARVWTTAGEGALLAGTGCAVYECRRCSEQRAEGALRVPARRRRHRRCAHRVGEPDQCCSVLSNF